MAATVKCVFILLWAVSSVFSFTLPSKDSALPESFYDICEEDFSNCVGAWSRSEQEDHGCIIHKNCTYVVGYEPKSDTSSSYVFHTLAFNKTYVAFGFSFDQGMGDDAVVECIQDGRGNGTGINSYLSYNVKFKNFREDTTEGVSLLESSFDDLWLYCRIEVSVELTYPKQEQSISLKGDQGYYLVAVTGSGKVDDNGDIVAVGGHRGHAYSENILFKNSALPESFYDICEEDFSNCVGAWSKSEQEDHECIIHKNCTYVVGHELRNDTNINYVFHTLAFNKTYVAFGFSFDQGMGDDAVVECIQDGRGKGTGINSYLSYNVEFQNFREDTVEGVSLLASSFEDLWLYCKIEVSAELTFPKQEKSISLKGDQSYFLVAVAGSGRVNENGEVVAVGHHKGHAYSDVELFKSGAAAVYCSTLLILISIAHSLYTS